MHWFGYEIIKTGSKECTGSLSPVLHFNIIFIMGNCMQSKPNGQELPRNRNSYDMQDAPATFPVTLAPPSPFQTHEKSDISHTAAQTMRIPSPSEANETMVAQNHSNHEHHRECSVCQRQQQDGNSCLSIGEIEAVIMDFADSVILPKQITENPSVDINKQEPQVRIDHTSSYMVDGDTSKYSKAKNHKKEIQFDLANSQLIVSEVNRLSLSNQPRNSAGCEAVRPNIEQSQVQVSISAEESGVRQQIEQSKIVIRGSMNPSYEFVRNNIEQSAIQVVMDAAVTQE